MPIRLECRDQKFSAGQYYIRSIGTAAVELRKKHRNKRERHVVQVERALEDWSEFLAGISEKGSIRRTSYPI